MSNNLKIRPVDGIDRKNLKISGGEPSEAEVYRKAFIGADIIGEALRRGTTCTCAC
jgi:hypothetical protein